MAFCRAEQRKSYGRSGRSGDFRNALLSTYFAPWKFPRMARNSSWLGAPVFVLRPLEIVSCPLKRKAEWASERGPCLARRAWRGSMSFSLSSHKTDFERPHCLTLPLFVRRPLCREREEREENGGGGSGGGPKKCGFGTSNQSGMGRGEEIERERERERAELTPCGGRVIKSSVSCRRWKSPPTTTTTTGPTEQQSRDKD